MATASGGFDYGPSDDGSRFRRLLNYNPTEFPELKPRANKRPNNKTINPRTGFEVHTFAEYYIMARNESDKTKNMDSINCFYIEKALNNHVGEGTIVKRLRDGTLQIKCKTERQAKYLLAICKFGTLNYSVIVTAHGTLNTTQAIIYCRNAQPLTEEEVVEGLQEQNQKVTQVPKIKKMVKGTLVDTPLCILTFNFTILPTHIKFGFIHLNVDLHVPRPMKCKNCFQFGHSKKKCSHDRCFALKYSMIPRHVQIRKLNV